MSSSGPAQSEYVTLVSGDGFEFIIPRSAACVSGTIRRMLDPSSLSLSLIPRGSTAFGTESDKNPHIQPNSPKHYPVAVSLKT
jgi:hypothetical protein